LDSAEDEEDSGGYICTYLDVPDNEEGEYGTSTGGAGGRVPPDEAAVREMIAKHAETNGGADTRADFLAAAAAAAATAAAAAGGEYETSIDAATATATATAIATDPADYTGRSPHPVLHLLRQSDVDAADDLWEKTHPGDDIRRRNAAALRGMGEQTLRAMLRKCMTRG